MVSIVIPTYNQEKTIGDAVWSAVRQDYPNKEIIVIDDSSTDGTFYYAYEGFGTIVKVLRNEYNLGIAGNLARCAKEAKGEYIVYLCGDDLFTDTSVVSDMVKIFEENPSVGVIGRNYYQFINGYEGAVTRVDEPNILISSCNPSGMGFRKCAMQGDFSKRIFIEMPYMVKKILSSGWAYSIMPYDTVAVRIHDNTATKSSYYTESPIANWNTLVPGYVFYGSAINLRIRAPQLLFSELMLIIKIQPTCLFSPLFWLYTLMGLLLPACILKKLSNFYRHRITRLWCKIKERE